MPAAPLFRRGDTIYLKSSAAIGRLDSFRVGNSREFNGKWVYQIGIAKKPPHQQTIGDRWDKRIPEGDIFYFEDELITLCEAIDIGINELNRSIVAVQAKQVVCDETISDPDPDPDPDFDPDGPKFEIGELVHLDVSARLGFFMSTRITGIFEIGVQPGSIKTKYSYTTDLKNTTIIPTPSIRKDEFATRRAASSRPPRGQTIFHREDEFVTVCEACPKVLASLNGQLADLIAKRDDLCSGI